MSFDKTTVDDGLSQGNVNWITQDNQGFIWIATNGGLNKYDGSTFQIFLHDDADSSSISNNIVNHISEDDEGKIWIATQNGLNIYDKSTESFIHFKNEFNNPYGLSSNQITCTVQDDFGNYWIGTLGGGLNCYNPTTGKFTVYRNVNNNLASISSNYITCLEKDKYGYIWVGTADNGLNMLDTETGKFLRYVKTDMNTDRSLSDNQINAIYEDNDGDLWVGTTSGMNLLRPKKLGRNLNNRDEVITFHPTVSKKSLAASSILSIYQGESGKIWFGTADNGLGYINKYTKSMANYLSDPNDAYSILSNNVKSVFNDKYGFLWVGTNAGINRIDRQSDRFKWHERTSGTTNTFSSNYITSIYKEKSGTLWLGTFDKGISKYDPVTEIYTNYQEDDYIVEGESIKERNRVLTKYDNRISSKKAKKIYYLSHNRINMIHRDQSKRLWIGTGEGLNVLHLSSGVITKYHSNPDSQFSLSSNNVTCIYEDKKGRIWIGTEDAGLNLFKHGKFTRYVSDKNDIFSISSNNISTITEDADGNLWIGTFGGGLNKFDPNEEKFTRYLYLESSSNSLSSNSIYTLYLDDNNQLWVGTTAGLNMMNLQTRRFRLFNQINGLTSNSVYSILEDNHENLWFGTNKGISKLNKNTFDVKNYDKEDGIKSTEFNPKTAFVTEDGEMLFGSINGYCSFYPDEIVDNQFKPDVIFTNFKILNEKVPVGKKGSLLTKHISETDTIRLSYKDVSITFEFAALNFTDAQKNAYAYRMENFESGWNYVGSTKFANYTNLQPGKYTFHVKASNNDGIWNEEGKSIFIIVKPPFWKTWWFYCLSLIFLVFSLILTIQLRTRALHRSKLLLEKQVTQRTRQIKKQNKILEIANKEILSQKNEIESQNQLLISKNIEISKAKKELDKKNDELISYSTNLEHIVEDRTSTLKHINNELVNANDELDLFIYRASHDLKGPIARLLGMTLLAKMDNKDDGLKEYIDLIEKGAVDINKVLNKLNNIHFINREIIITEEIDFKKIITESKKSLLNYIDANDLHIELESEPKLSLRSDYFLIKIILENLLENSVFFKKTQKAQIKIKLHSSRNTTDISVTDNGLGIPREQYERIFDMFYRGSERSKGNGLGLYLVRKSVQKLHGKITVDSEEGKYACFTISLPKVIVPKELESLVN